ncbi:hypothetical protein MNBD_GAMMA26-91 [hydrothermal vent metagenome]|uniref:DNA mismatch repair protein MutS-like N-terminal domain-containing protein n=1 Tax=hydrothermal vent metagenome TaxID=652676 RepID=A0A3B1APC7_9ZZZZ
MLANSPDQLAEWKRRIEVFLADQLKLELNPVRTRLAPVSNGIDFLGYIVRRDYLLVRRRVVNHLKEKLRDFEAQLVEQRDAVRRYRFDEVMLDQLHATLSSYLGHFKLANTRNLWQKIWQKYPYLAVYFEWDEVYGRLERRFKTPKGLKRVRQQYGYFRWRFPDAVLFFQVGRFFEFYSFRDAAIAETGTNGLESAWCAFWVSRGPLQPLSRGVVEKAVAGSGDPVVRAVLDGSFGTGASVVV